MTDKLPEGKLLCFPSESAEDYRENYRTLLIIFHNFSGSRSKLVNAINRFYTQNTESDIANSNLNFNLPQYFVLSEDEISIHPFTIMNAGSS